MNDIAALRRAVDQLLEGQLGPLLELLAEGVSFEVAGCGDVPESWMGSGTRPVVEYFTALGALPSFWQIDYSPVDGQVIAWGREQFTVLGCGLEGESEFALVFDFADGRIVRLQVIEDLSAFVREGGRMPEPEAA
jgi:hypothetical protein